MRGVRRATDAMFRRASRAWAGPMGIAISYPLWSGECRPQGRGRCCLGRCSRDADELPVVSVAAEVDGDRSLVRMLKGDAATNIRSYGERLERGWQHGVIRSGHVFFLLRFVVPHEPVQVVAAWRRKAILDRQIVECQMIVNNSKSFQRKHRAEPGPAN